MKEIDAIKLVKAEVKRIFSNFTGSGREVTLDNYYEFKENVSRQKDISHKICVFYNQNALLFDKHFLVACEPIINSLWRNEIEYNKLTNVEGLWKVLDPCYKKAADIKAHQELKTLIDDLRSGNYRHRRYNLHVKLQWHQKEMAKINFAGTFPEPEYEKLHFEIAKAYCSGKGSQNNEKKLFADATSFSCLQSIADKHSLNC